MRWEAEWWGVALIAETEQDEHLLEELDQRLPEQAEPRYERGAKELLRAKDGALSLVLER
jgi:hypothetical protein